MSDALDRLVRESRPELGTREVRNVDWAKVDESLFRRVEAEQSAERRALAEGPGRAWAVVLGSVAAAAAVAFVMAKGNPTHVNGVQAVVEDGAGTITAVEGTGALLVDGKPAAVGTLLHEGDIIDARGAQATVDRPGKLTLVLERGARATVTHTQGALVLALEEGAVEAQVVPVPNGEAFAVDVGASRVAVHGTHLRVARAGGHVVVNLNEGVVSLGGAPRIGSTLGTLITAPAHAEFTTDEPEATLSLTHDAASVRRPISFGAPAPAAVASMPPALGAPKLETADVRAPGLLSPASPHAAPTPQPASHPVAVADPNPAATVAAAVRSCLAQRPRADNVTVVFNTTLRLELDADGTVQSARFNPPVAPDVNSCAAASIYRARFAHGGSEAIPVDFRVPSSAP